MGQKILNTSYRKKRENHYPKKEKRQDSRRIKAETCLCENGLEEKTFDFVNFGLSMKPEKTDTP